MAAAKAILVHKGKLSLPFRGVSITDFYGYSSISLYLMTEAPGRTSVASSLARIIDNEPGLGPPR